MATKPGQRENEQRTDPRQTFCVPFRMIATGRATEPIDGETLDISSKGLGVKLGRRNMARVDMLLEGFVEDRLSVEVTLRLPEGSVSALGQVMWWGLLGDDDKFGLRAGILLHKVWSDSDWALIQKNLGRA